MGSVGEYLHTPDADPSVVEVDVAVIGGGPTGLLSALLCEYLGASVCVIDAKPGPLELGRADALNARTQQYLEVVGVLDDLLPKGIKCNTSSTFADGEFKSRQSHWWTSLAHCLHRNFLMLGQPEVEAALLARLRTPVRFGEKAVAIAETEPEADAGGVAVTTDRGRTIRSQYAIAADGARSTVRQALGIPFAGTKPEMLWAVLDTFIKTDFPVCSEIITFQLREQSRVAWIPRERGLARFYTLLDGGPITQERAERSIREHLAPHTIDFVKTEWFSTFEVKERIAETFVSKQGAGRILLAGDAAHVHSVNGGQGLNTGIADAFALSWRVAAAVTVTRSTTAALAPGGARKLIRSYDTERRQVAQEVIDVAARLVRDTMHTAKQYVATIEKNAGFITGMGVSYDGLASELITESERGIWKAGKRCPDIYLRRAGDDPRRLYSLISYGKFLILRIGGGQSADRDFGNVCAYFTLRPEKTQGAGSPETAVEDGVFSADVVSGDENFVVVVRPDMYIGYVGEGDAWKEYLAEIYVH